LEDFKKFWKSASEAVNIKECSFSCRGFLKMPFACIVWDIPISKTSIGLDPNYNNKRGAKKGSKYKKATSALMMDAD